MTRQISILIPTFNTDCRSLVQTLANQASLLQTEYRQSGEFEYEIVVADDCSTNDIVKVGNSQLRLVPQVRYIELPENQGRARIRNFLVQEARFGKLLFIDADMQILHNDFLRLYAETESPVVCGDYELVKPANGDRNLRYLYEEKIVSQRTLQWRLRNRYRAFRVCNLLIDKAIMLNYPFSTGITDYGYEDLLLGAQLEQANVPILHIDNPVAFHHFEGNMQFMAKTEESLHTLKNLETELADLSLLLKTARLLSRLRLCRIYSYIFARYKDKWRTQLCSKNPSVRLFSLYKLGYWLTL